ncbi:biotin carboxylase N-terminal domain-containing protein [Vagococcus lutrae]
MINKVLVANREEIAIRIFRACNHYIMHYMYTIMLFFGGKKV